MNDYHPSIIVNLQRLINNLIRSGIINSVENDRVRVKTGDIITAPLPWFTTRAGSAKTWWRPTVGEQVFILSPNGNLELGCVLPAIYSNLNKAPSNKNDCHAVFPDGASFNYNPANSTLTIDNIKNVIINASSAINITCTTTDINSSDAINITTKSAKLTTEQADITAMQTSIDSPQITVTSSDITFNASNIKLNAPLVACSGVLSFASLAGLGGGAPSVINGNISINGVLQNNGVNLTTHTHALPGYGTTLTPQ